MFLLLPILAPVPAGSHLGLNPWGQDTPTCFLTISCHHSPQRAQLPGASGAILGLPQRRWTEKTSSRWQPGGGRLPEDRPSPFARPPTLHLTTGQRRRPPRKGVCYRHRVAFEKRKAREAAGGCGSARQARVLRHALRRGPPAGHRPHLAHARGHREAAGSRSCRNSSLRRAPRLPPSEAEGRSARPARARAELEGTHGRRPPQGRCTSAGNRSTGVVLSTTGHSSASPGCDPVTVTVATVTVA